DIKAVIVQCGQEEYALPVETVVSIEKLERVNPIPHLPDYMLGLMKIRGELVPILDFQQILYGNAAKEDPNARVVVVQTENLYIGLLVLDRSEEHTSELQSRENLVCRLLLEKKKFSIS